MIAASAIPGRGAGSGPDLGLDLRKVPDLTDPATRKRLSPAGIEAFFKIIESWELKSEDGMALLGGISNGRYYELKRSRKGILTQDELTRVSLLIGITGNLRINGLPDPTAMPCSEARRR